MALNKDNIKTLIGSTLIGFHNNILKNKLVPAGGTTGQVLSKTSDTDNDVEWISISTSENDLTDELKANYDDAYIHSQSAHFDGDYNSLTNLPDIPNINGGTTGQILAKTSNNNNDVQWINMPDTSNFLNKINKNTYYECSDLSYSNPEILDDYYQLNNFGSYVFNKSWDLKMYGGSTLEPYNIDLINNGEVQFTLTPDKFSFNDTKLYYEADTITRDGTHYKIYATSHYVANDGTTSNKIIVSWDCCGIPYDTIRIYTTNNNQEKIDVAYAYSQATHSYNDLTDKPDIPSIEGLATEEYVNNNKVTKTSELTNDSGFVTSIPDEYITETELEAKNYIDNTTLESKGYLTEHQDLSDYALRSDLHTHSNKAILDAITSAKITEWNNKSTFSGSYNDLTNKPTIPTITNDLTNALKANYDAAYTHSQNAHAPSNAQKNSDITKAEIEAKLTGNITTHTHSQYLTEHQDISGLALKSELHTHTNKSILDAITSDKINSWDSKSTFSGSYNDLADKPTFATESYVDNKFASEEIIFEGQSNDPLVLFDYYTHVPIDDGMAFWVIDKTLEINSTYNPYTVEISGCQPSSLNGTYGPELFTYNSTYDMWECNLGNGFKIQLGNTEYQGSNKMVVSWDTAGNYSNLKVTKRVDLMNTINSKVDKAYVDGKVSDLVNSSPATLDTLKELADALGNDPNFATTVSNQIGNKVDKVNGKGLSTNDLTNTLKANYDAAYTHSKSAHAPSNAQKNSDITKAEIEAKLTGNITTHTHSQYLTSIPSEYITEQELTNKGYITEAVLTSKGYATESQINSAVEAAATTDEEVKTTVNQILGGAYIE